MKAEVRLYDRLFTKENPVDENDGMDFKTHLNPNSLKTITAYMEPSLKDAQPGNRYQFERVGYFCVDLDSTTAKLIFNRTIALQDIWARIKKAAKSRNRAPDDGRRPGKD